jgi:hypothetical protein
MEGEGGHMTCSRTQEVNGIQSICGRACALSSVTLTSFACGKWHSQSTFAWVEVLTSCKKHFCIYCSTPLRQVFLLHPSVRSDLLRITWTGNNWIGTLALSDFLSFTWVLSRGKEIVEEAISTHTERLNLLGSKQHHDSVMINSYTGLSFPNTHHTHKNERIKEHYFSERGCSMTVLSTGGLRWSSCLQVATVNHQKVRGHRYYKFM